jgi:uncharacterized damage-inducible protein DinB
MTDHIRRLYEHLAWADARTLEALRSMHAPPPDALRLFGHVVAAEHVWLTRIEGRAAEMPVWPSLGLEECAAVAARNQAGFAAVIGSSGDDAFARELRYRNTSGAEFVNRIEDILLHVAMHGQYHRGQVARIVRSEGGVPLSTDYIFFIRDAASPVAGKAS